MRKQLITAEEAAILREIDNSNSTNSRKGIIASIGCVVLTIFGLLFLPSVLHGPVLFINMTGLAILLALLLKGVIFRVPMNHLGLPESYFTGRFAPGNNEANRQPIHAPYSEGLHLKPFWWRICFVDRRVQTRKIEERKYQTKDGAVLISGLVEFRNSFLALFRVPDVDQTSIGPGLDALIDDKLSKKTAKLETEDALHRDGDLNQTLRNKLMRESNPPRTVYGHQLSESEVKYAIEILTVHITAIDPLSDYEQDRTERLKEKYQKESQETERGVLNADVQAFIEAGIHPDLALKMAMQRQGKLPSNMADERINIDAPDTVSAFVGSMFKGKFGSSSNSEKGGDK